jgi:hypothetical protein
MNARPGCLLALAAAVACGHTEPFGTTPVGSDQPFVASPPVRLTFNRGADREATWLPDGSAILYSTQPAGRRDSDVCLALLPSTGGSQRQVTCNLSPAGDDSTDAFESPALAGDGRLAGVVSSSPIGVVASDVQAIVLTSLASPAANRVVKKVPYTIPGLRTHAGVSQLRWLGSNRLVYIGEQITYRRPCAFCQIDTLRSGLDAVWLDVNDPTASPRVVAGADFASGVSPGASEDEVYYTLGGDTRVYREVLSTGAASMVYDFGAAGIAREVHVVGNRLAAVVGGRVAFGNDPVIGPTQWDSGGVLHMVSLSDGADVIVGSPGLSRRPQLSPTGSEIVAEVYPLIIDPLSNDTTVSRVGDLYLFTQP